MESQVKRDKKICWRLKPPKCSRRLHFNHLKVSLRTFNIF